MHALPIREKEDGVILFHLKFHGSTLCYFLMKFLFTIFLCREGIWHGSFSDKIITAEHAGSQEK